MREVVRYLLLWRRFLLLAVARETEYRANFLATAGESIAQVALAILTFLVVYRFTNTVAGWTRDQALVLVGVYRVVEGIINLQIAPNMYAIGSAIRRGDMDFVLLRPISSRFLVSLRVLTLSEAVNIPIGVGIVIYAGTLAGVRWTVPNVAEATLVLLCGVILLYALWFAIMTCSFWLVQVNNLDNLFLSVIEGARYPVSYFTGPVRALLTFVVPVAFATTFPSEALFGRLDGRFVGVGMILAACALTVTHVLWNRAVRSYSSASS